MSRATRKAAEEERWLQNQAAEAEKRASELAQRQQAWQDQIDAMATKSSKELKDLAVKTFVLGDEDYMAAHQAAHYAKASALAALAGLAYLQEQNTTTPELS